MSAKVKIPPLPPGKQTAQSKRNMFKKTLTINHKEELTAEMIQDVSEANMQKALEYKEKNMLRAENKHPYPMGVETKIFAKYGIGLRLFFEFVKLSALCFLVMAFISIPSIYSNATGNGLETNYSSHSSNYAAFSIANQPDLKLIQPKDNATEAEKEAIRVKNDVIIEDFVTEMNDRSWWIIIPDMAYTSVFVIFIFFWRRRSKQIKKESIVSEANPSHYAIFAWGFSEDIQDTVYLKKHFTQFGHIQEVAIVRNYFGTLFHHKKEADLLHKISIEKKRVEMKGEDDSKKLQKLDRQLAKVHEDLSKITQKKLGSVVSHDKYPSLGAYIVFNRIEDKLACIKAYDDSHAFCGKKDPRCFFQDKLLSIREKVEEPSNIKWENLDVGPKERGFRMCAVFFAVLAVMFLTFIVIFIANIVKPSSSNNCGSEVITFEDAKAQNDKDVTKCFCNQQSFSTLKNDLDIQGYCWDTYVEFVWLTALTVATAVTVVMVNFLLKILLRALGRFSKYPTITKETLGITVSLFAAMFVNTALITLMLQADIFDWKPAVSISSPVPPIQDLQQEKATDFSPDFDRQWYTEVGSKITVTMMVNMVSPHLMFWTLIPCYRKNRLKKAKQQVIQRDMNSFITGPQFQVTAYYAAVLNTIFVTLFYAPGMPILLWFASISLGIQYWVYKYYLLRYNKKPPSYDQKLNKKIITILPFAAILHLMIAIYMYGSPLIFPLDASVISSTYNSDMAVPDPDNSFSTISDRIKNQTFMFILLVVTIALQIIDRTLLVFLKKFYRCLFCVKKENKLSHVAPAGNKKKKVFGTYQEEYEGMKNRMLASYDIRLNEEYSNLIRAIEVGKEDHERQLSNRDSGRERADSRASKQAALYDPENPNLLTPNKVSHQKKINFNNGTSQNTPKNGGNRPSKSSFTPKNQAPTAFSGATQQHTQE